MHTYDLNSLLFLLPLFRRSHHLFTPIRTIAPIIKDQTRPRSCKFLPKMPSGWACWRCSFINDVSHKQCSVCKLPCTPQKAHFQSLSYSPSSCFLRLSEADDDIDYSLVGSVFRPLHYGLNHRKEKEKETKKEKEKIVETESSGTSSASSSSPRRKRPLPVAENSADDGWVSMKKPLSASPDIKSEEKPGSTGEVEFLKNTFMYMTYNVWFENLRVHERMKALGDLIENHQPDFICLQEVTPDIYDILRVSSWWEKYTCSVSYDLSRRRAYFCIQLSRLPVNRFRRKAFRNTVMGRELCIAEIDIGSGKQLAFATTHLESPCPAPPTWNQWYSKERVYQANESFRVLDSTPNVIFGGDMNWDESRDGDPPLPDGWFDAWVELRPAEDGWTYDTKSNQMLAGNRTLRKRLDRIFCHLQDFEVESIDMIGTAPIPGLFYQKEKKSKNQTHLLTLPVLPSDHFGLLLKLRTQG